MLSRSIVALLAVLVSFLPPALTPRAAAQQRMYGVLYGHSSHLQTDWDAGMRVREVELSWRRYEPKDGVWDSNFIGEKRWEFQQARAAGFQLVLDFGIQYPPDWARKIRPWRDQHGNSYDGQVNPISSAEVRKQIEQYLDRVFKDFGADWLGVRVGAGGSNETMYPGTPAGVKRSYWAFDSEKMALNPVPNWRPGQPSPNGEARRFYEWYLQNLIKTVNWQHSVIRRHYQGKILQLFAGIGVRPAGYEHLIQDNLYPQPHRIGVDAAERGVVIDRVIDGITDKRNVVIVSTSLGDSFATAPWLDELSADPMKWSSAHWVAYNARRHGMQRWGENTGNDDYANMQLVFKQMKDFGYTALFWAWGYQLYDGKHASLNDYKRMIATYR